MEEPVIQSQAAQQIVIKYTIRDSLSEREFTDAIYYTPEEYLKTTPEQIRQEQRRRYENWVAVITTPRPEPTEEQKAEHIEMLKQQQLIAQEQILRMAPSPVDALAILDRQAEIISDQAKQLRDRIESQSQ